MMQKLKSRKFILALLGAVLPIVGAYFSGDIAIGEALQLSAAVVVSYIFGQGYVDAKAVEASK
tara:strand:+ start:6039 stop:6227 length:189 start_codon:yes stop_codon:yes gene_type:complete